MHADTKHLLADEAFQAFLLVVGGRKGSGTKDLAGGLEFAMKSNLMWKVHQSVVPNLPLSVEEACWSQIDCAVEPKRGLQRVDQRKVHDGLIDIETNRESHAVCPLVVCWPMPDADIGKRGGPMGILNVLANLFQKAWFITLMLECMAIEIAETIREGLRGCAGVANMNVRVPKVPQELFEKLH